jgi:superfamily I DNA/RNA helicase
VKLSVSTGSIPTMVLSPDPRQQEVLAHDGGVLLVTGEAGTGKSAVLRERFARLLEAGATPERVALVVRTGSDRDAAQAALLARLEASMPRLRVATIHGLANQILQERFAALDYSASPLALPAAEQFAKVRDLLDGEDPDQWPGFGSMLHLRGFADELRQFVLRAQEALLTPDEIVAKSGGDRGWNELAGFLRRYQEVLDAQGVVDFAGMVEQAAVVAALDAPMFDHVLVDDYQDTFAGAEALLAALRAPDLVVAGNPEAHLFSFQGTTVEPMLRFADRFAGAEHIALGTNHRAPEPVAIEGWTAPHSSEEFAAIARELRRLHVVEDVAWEELAVVVRRQGSHLGGLLRALDDARVPRVVPERGLTLDAEPGTHPYVLALQWIARPDGREESVEALLTSDLAGLSPAAARGLTRSARARRGSIADALDEREGLTAAEAESVASLAHVLVRAEATRASILDTFAILWRELSHSGRLVASAEHSAEARRDLDAVLALARAVSDAADEPVEAFLEALEAGEHGPGINASDRSRSDAVKILTAHGAVGREFDTVLVAGAVEGNFPSLQRPEPMFDLATLERPITQSERNRLRLEDERRLFRSMLGRARRRVVLLASLSGDDGGASISRFADELRLRWAPAPAGPFGEPVSTREATVTWRRQLADLAAEPALRLASLEGLLALGVDPRTWWFQRDWTDDGRPLHEGVHASYSKLQVLENCELQYVLSAELGLGSPAGYQAWVGKTVHKIIEDCEKGHIERRLGALTDEVDERWRSQEFPSMAVSEAWRSLAKHQMLPNWFARYGESPAASTEGEFLFDYDGATIHGFIDRIGPNAQGSGNRITDYKTGNADYAPKAVESLQLGIYYLAVQEAEELEAFRPIEGVELAYLKGHWRTGEIELREWETTAAEREATYQQAMRERLSGLIGSLARLNEDETYRPNPQAQCRFCDFRSLCSLWPEGAPVIAPEPPAERTPQAGGAESRP